jgi:hypothetical protein
MIKSVTIENFRSIERAEVELAPLLFCTGPRHPANRASCTLPLS